MTYSQINVLLGQFRITCRTSNCRRKWAFFYQWGAIPQRGNSCETCRVLWYDVFHESGNTHEGKEVDEYSCLSRIQKKNLSTDISKLVVRLVRHYDQDEREPNGADHGNSTHPKLLWASESEEHENFLTRIVYAAFRKVAARQGSSIVQIQRIPYCTLVQFRHTLVDTSYQNWWISLKFHTIRKNLSFTDDTLLTSILSMQLVFFTPLNSFGKIQMKKNQAMICQGQGQFIITANGDTTKMLFFGENCLEHKIKHYDFGKQDQTRPSYTILCLQIASTG